MRSATACILICLTLIASAVMAAPAATAYHKIKTIPVTGDGGWDYLTFDSGSHRIYIARSDRVQVVDVNKATLLGEVPNTQGVHGVALVPALKRGFASNGRDNSVTVFDLGTLKEVQRVKVGTRPDAIIFDPASNRVFTVNAGSQDATAIDVATNNVVGTVSLGGKPEFPVSDGKGSIFVNIEDKSEIVAFDAKTLSVKSHWPLAPGQGPSGLAIDRKNHRFSRCARTKKWSSWTPIPAKSLPRPQSVRDRMPLCSIRPRVLHSVRTGATGP